MKQNKERAPPLMRLAKDNQSQLRKEILMLNQNVIVLSVSKYSITNDAGKVENEGCTVRYIMNDNLAPFEDEKLVTRGYKPAKATMPIEDYQRFSNVPGLYSLDMVCKVDSTGKATLAASKFSFVSDITNGKATINIKSAATS